VRNPKKAAGLPPGIELASGDLETGAGLADALKDADTVIHLAGVTKARTVSEYHLGNAVATTNLLRAAAHVRRLVHVSSLAAAGPSPAGLALREADPPRPMSHYGRSKLAGEQAVRGSALAGRTVIVRPPVVYGPRDRDVLQMLRTIAKGWMAQIGAAPRRFSHIYVGDLVDGLIAAADSNDAGGELFYLADATPVSWEEFARAAARLMGRRVHAVAIPESAAYVLGMCAEGWSKLSGTPGILSRDKVREACCTGWVCDPSHARLELGFSARTGLERGLHQTLDWYKEAGWLQF
jgi:nucleoside-diphosphate-sugar epimerase